MKWAEDLWNTIQRCDWRSRRGDVLRVRYESFGAESDRHVFGDFYTPDWLAGMMVKQVLDGDWLERAVPAAEVGLQTGEPLKDVGILDPACGSSTFLYHAALQIVQADTMFAPLLRTLRRNATRGADPAQISEGTPVRRGLRRGWRRGSRQRAAGAGSSELTNRFLVGIGAGSGPATMPRIFRNEALITSLR